MNHNLTKNKTKMALSENIKYLIEAVYPIVKSGFVFEHADGKNYQIILPKNRAEELSDYKITSSSTESIDERLYLFNNEVDIILEVGNRERIIELRVSLRNSISHYDKVCFDYKTLNTFNKGILEKIDTEKLFITNHAYYVELLGHVHQYQPYERRLYSAKFISCEINKACEKIESVLASPPTETTPVGENKPKTVWTPDATKARRIMNRFDTYLENEIKQEQGKKTPLTNKRISDVAIELTCKDSAVNLSEKSLTRYVQCLHKLTAKAYAGQYVEQKFKRN